MNSSSVSGGERLLHAVVEVIDAPARFLEISPAWDTLWRRNPDASPFVSTEWLLPWWRQYGRQGGLRVVVVFLGDRLIGGWALWVRQVSRLRALSFDTLTSLGAGGDTALDYLDPVVDAEHKDLALDGIRRGIRQASAGLAAIQLSDVSADVPLILDALEGVVGRSKTASYRKIPTIQLQDRWETLIGGFSKTRQRTIATRVRRLERAGAVWATLRDSSGLSTQFESLVDLHLKRWSKRDVPHAFSSAAYIGFHREVMTALAARGALRLHSLSVDGRTVAMLYCFREGRRIFYVQGGFDPEFSKLSPGAALFDFAVRSAVEEGAGEFDMLRGDYAFKQQWANGSRLTMSCTRYSMTAAGLFLASADRVGNIARSATAFASR